MNARMGQGVCKQGALPGCDSSEGGQEFYEQIFDVSFNKPIYSKHSPGWIKVFQSVIDSNAFKIFNRRGVRVAEKSNPSNPDCIQT